MARERPALGSQLAHCLPSERRKKAPHAAQAHADSMVGNLLRCRACVRRGPDPEAAGVKLEKVLWAGESREAAFNFTTPTAWK